MAESPPPLPRIANMLILSKKQKKRNRKGHDHQRTSWDPGQTSAGEKNVQFSRIVASAFFKKKKERKENEAYCTHNKHKTTLKKNNPKKTKNANLWTRAAAEKARLALTPVQERMSRRRCVRLSGCFVCLSVC